MGLLVFGAAELASQFGLRQLFGGLDLRTYAAQRLAADTQAENGALARAAAIRGDDALHPYLGYLKPEAFGELFAALAEPKPDGEIWGLVVGGSVADRLDRDGELQQALQALIAAVGGKRRLRLFNGANGGNKQPQQLLLVSYLLALDAPVDLVINLDGFNEVVLPYADNARLGVEPSYPRAWANRLAIRSGEVDLLVVAEISRLRERQRRAAGWVAESPFGVLASVRLVAALLYSDAEGRVMALQDRLRPRGNSLSLEQRGSVRTDWEPGEVQTESARLWARSSLLLADLLERHGIAYYHFLQPNQYLEGSKPLSAEERAHCYRPEGRYGSAARAGYPLLLETAREHGLTRIRYFDATALFAAESATVYVDACCHLNPYGNRMLAAFVARNIREHSRRLAP